MTLPFSLMLATAAKAIPSGDGWRFEVKWDGIRAVVAHAGDGVRVWSRHSTDFTTAFPELHGLADVLDPGAVLDGELVVCDGEGRPDFRRVRRRMMLRAGRAVAATPTDPALFVAFDLLRLGGEDLVDLSWVERHALLVDVLADRGPGWMVNATYEDGASLWEATREQRLEGIVAKRIDAAYRPGRRTDAWVKVKHTTRTALPVVGVRNDAVLVADARTFRPIGWVDRFHPSVDRRSLPGSSSDRSDGPVGLCVVQHLATSSGGLREAVVLALRPLGPGTGSELPWAG